MFCRICGASIPEDSIFCPQCGTKISSSFTKEVIKTNMIMIQTSMLCKSMDAYISLRGTHIVSITSLSNIVEKIIYTLLLIFIFSNVTCHFVGSVL